MIAAPATPEGIDAREAFCREVVAEAGRLALKGFRRRATAEIGMKGAQDFLTETDAAVERFLRERIAQAFPSDDFLGEEDGGAVDGSSVWVVDPIDGTANFARSIAHFCVSIAYVRDGLTELGAILSPATDEFWFARRGRGASCNGKPIRVASTDRFAAACLELGWSNRRPQTAYLDAMERLLTQGANVRRGASGALGLAYVADGRSDGYVELHMQPWDSFAGLLLVEEAGGRICDLPKNTLKEGAAVLAAVPALAEAIGEACGIRLRPPPEEAQPVRRVLA